MPRTPDYTAHLALVPLFSALSQKDLRTVARQAEIVTVPAGTVIVKEGATGDAFYVILDGIARVERKGRKVTDLLPGGFFGDLALLDRGPRNATVAAHTDLEVAELGQKQFNALLELPGFSKKLLVGLARRLREADAKAAL